MKLSPKCVWNSYFTMFAKTVKIFRFRLLPRNVKTHSWKNRGERNFLMGSQTAFLNVTDDQEHDNTEFFILTLSEFLWLFLYQSEKRFDWALKSVTCNPVIFLYLSLQIASLLYSCLKEGGTSATGSLCEGRACLLSPAPWRVCGFRVSSVAAPRWVFTIQIIPFFPQEVTHKSSFLSNFLLLLSIINALGESERKDEN